MKSLKLSDEMAAILFQGISAMLVSFLFLFAFGSKLGIHRVGWMPVAAVIAGSFLVAFWWKRPWGQKLWGILLVLLVAAVVHFLVGLETMKLFWFTYGRWLNGIPAETEELRSAYILLQTLWIVLAVGVFTGLTVGQRFVEWILGLAAVVLLVLSYLNIYTLNRTAVAFCLIYCLFVFVGFYWLFWEKRRNAENPVARSRKYRVFLTPAFLVFLVLLLYAPVKDTPMEWTAIKRIIVLIEDRFTEWKLNRPGAGQNEFEMTMSGMDGDPGGKPSENPHPLVDIFSTVMPQTNLYLTGFVWSDFDGREWSGRKDTSQADMRIDALETRYAVLLSDLEQEDIIRSATVNVRYQYFHSDAPFLPLKYLGRVELHNATGSDQDKLGYNTSYEVTYQQVNLGLGELYTYLENLPADDEKVWNQVNYYQRKSGVIYDFEELLSYRQQVREEYGKQVVLSKPVQSWLDTLFEENKYFQGEELTDLRKLLLIESALAGFRYVKPAEEIPETVSDETAFLEYLLLEKQEGYCTHFATSFVLLARSLGYPARLCQGFLAPTKEEREIHLYADDAHAWPEVYFEGFGWVPFEPTPGYGIYRYTPWDRIVKQNQDEIDWSAFEKYREDKQHHQEGPSEPQTSLTQQEQRKAEILDFLILLGKIAVGIAIILVVSLLSLILFMVISAKRISKRPPAEQLLWYGKQNDALLARIDMERDPSETLEEFARRLKQEKLPGGETLGMLEQILYREEEGSIAMVIQADQENAKVLESVEEVEGKNFYLRLYRLYRKFL